MAQKPMKRTPLRKVSTKQRAKISKKKEEIQAMQRLFMEIWAERPHISEVSGKRLGDMALSWMFHHILPKSKYKDYIFRKDNIILLTFEEHEKVENNPTFFEEVNKRREKLLKRFDI